MNTYSAKNISKNTFYNLAGQVFPLLIGVASMPILIKNLGNERFGILTLAWTVIGYYSLFDFGLSRAITKIVAQKNASQAEGEVKEIFWMGSFLLIVLGIAGGLIVFAGSGYLVRHILNIPAALISEALWSFKILALSLPVVLLSSGTWGFLAAFQRFDLINALRIPLGAMNFLSPLLIIAFTKKLPFIVLTLAGTRIILFFLGLKFCIGVHPLLKSRISVTPRHVRELFGFGMWVSVSNVINPLLMALDRFFIGSLRTMRQVAFYTIPMDLLMKMLSVPGALAAVLFPAFSGSYVLDKGKTSILLERGLKYTLFILFPIILVICLFAREGLSLWLGPEYAQYSYRVLQILSLGTLFNGIALIPYSLLQGLGRPDLTAKLHFVELLVYVVLLYSLIHKSGIEGAALAWGIRAFFDAIGLLLLSRKSFPELHIRFVPYFLAGLASLAVLILSLFMTSFGAKIGLGAALLSIFIFVVWKFLLDQDEKTGVSAFLRHCLPAR